jgi:hypothetical protein
MSRPSMRDRLAIGQRWQRRRDRQIARIRQIHRPDRLAELELLNPPPTVRPMLLVAFSDLRTKWRALVETPSPTERTQRT